jgi:hypothetical protein
MAYISSDGKLVEGKPFGLGTILAFFLAIFDFIIYFFKTLFGMTPEKGSSTRGGHVPSKNSGAFSGSSGSNQKPYGGGSGLGRNVTSMSSLKTNTNFSSCPGGACGGGPSI